MVGKARRTHHRTGVLSSSQSRRCSLAGQPPVSLTWAWKAWREIELVLGGQGARQASLLPSERLGRGGNESGIS